MILKQRSFKVKFEHNFDRYLLIFVEREYEIDDEGNRTYICTRTLTERGWVIFPENVEIPSDWLPSISGRDSFFQTQLEKRLEEFTQRIRDEFLCKSED